MNQRRCEYCGSLEVDPIRRFPEVDTEKCRNCAAPMRKAAPPQVKPSRRPLQIGDWPWSYEDAISFSTGTLRIRVDAEDFDRSIENAMIDVTTFGDAQRRYISRAELARPPVVAPPFEEEKK